MNGPLILTFSQQITRFGMYLPQKDRNLFLREALSLAWQNTYLGYSFHIVPSAIRNSQTGRNTFELSQWLTHQAIREKRPNRCQPDY